MWLKYRRSALIWEGFTISSYFMPNAAYFQVLKSIWITERPKLLWWEKFPCSDYGWLNSATLSQKYPTEMIFNIYYYLLIFIFNI